MPTFGAAVEDDPNATELFLSRKGDRLQPLTPSAAQGPVNLHLQEIPNNPSNQQADFLKAFNAISGEEAETRKAANKEIGAATDATIQAGRDFSAASQKATNALTQNMQRTPAPPDLKGIQSDAMHWMALVGAVGAIFGRGSRNNGVYGLTAMTGMAQGFAKGSWQSFETNLDRWKSASEAVEKNNQREIDSYKAIMQNQKTNWDQKMQELQLISSKWQNQIMASAAQKQDLVQASTILANQERLQDQLKLQNLKLAQFADNYEMRTDEGLAKVGWTPEAIDTAAQTYIQTGRKPTNLGTRQVATYVSGKINARIAEIMQEQGLKAEDLATNWQKFAGGTSYQRIAGTQGARVESATNEVEQLIPQAIETSRALPRGNFVPINVLAQRYQAGTSDPAYNDFIVANFSLLNAYTRAMNPQGVPRVSDRLEQHAIGLLSQATSQQAYEVQVRRLWKEVQASKSAVAQTRAGAQPGNPTFPGDENGAGAQLPSGGVDPASMTDDQLRRALGIQ